MRLDELEWRASRTPYMGNERRETVTFKQGGQKWIVCRNRETHDCYCFYLGSIGRPAEYRDLEPIEAQAVLNYLLAE